MKLYELTDNYRNLLELLDNPDLPQAEIEGALSGLTDDIANKLENITKIIKMKEGNVKTFKEEEKRLSSLRKVEENQIEYLKGYMYSCMKLCKLKKVESDLFKFSIAKTRGKVIVSPDFNNEKYLIEQPKVVDKKALYDVLKEGIEVEGARLEEGESLRIK